MVINLSAVQPFLIVLLPIIMPYLGDFSASVLAQDGFPQFVNDLIAWAVLLVTSVAAAIASGAIIGPFVTWDWALMVSILVGVATALLAGPLTSLNRWVNFTALVQSHVFNIIPAFLALVAPSPRPSVVVAQPTTGTQPQPSRPAPQPIMLPQQQPQAAPVAQQAFPAPLTRNFDTTVGPAIHKQ